jgi:hypothetical protein
LAPQHLRSDHRHHHHQGQCGAGTEAVQTYRNWVKIVVEMLKNQISEIVNVEFTPT